MSKKVEKEERTVNHFNLTALFGDRHMLQMVINIDDKKQRPLLSASHIFWDLQIKGSQVFFPRKYQFVISYTFTHIHKIHGKNLRSSLFPAALYSLYSDLNQAMMKQFGWIRIKYFATDFQFLLSLGCPSWNFRWFFQGGKDQVHVWFFNWFIAIVLVGLSRFGRTDC